MKASLQRQHVDAAMWGWTQQKQGYEQLPATIETVLAIQPTDPAPWSWRANHLWFLEQMLQAYMKSLDSCFTLSSNVYAMLARLVLTRRLRPDAP